MDTGLSKTIGQTLGGGNNADANGVLTKEGAGKLTLSVDNSYYGGTTISGGTLEAGSAGALGAGAVTIESGATLRVAAGTFSISNTLSFKGGGIERVSGQSLGTVANIVAGTASSAVALSPTVAWSARVAGTTYSDVLGLTNTSSTFQILQMTYDPTILGGTSASNLQLGWKNGSEWVNAVVGNIGSVGGSALTNQSSSFASLGITATSAYLGSWGRDTSSNTVWAVVDHNSDFGVIAAVPVPEPSSVQLIGGVAVVAGLIARRRRRARRV